MRYPNGQKKEYKKANISYGNRGMGLEAAINESNEYYRLTNKALIYKKPTPITVSKVNYKSRFEAVITEAYYKTPSTTDYNGVYKGFYIDFEAKETRNKSFPLANIHAHQIEHLKQVLEHQGISFLIISFMKEQEIYLLKTEDLLNITDRKSIPLSYMREKGYRIEEGYNPRIDYLKIIDQLIEEEAWNKK